MEKVFDSIVRLKESGWTEDQAKALFRRFIPIGTKEELDKFHSLAEEKNLSREDLRVILRAIKLNQGEAHDLAIIKNELQDIRTTLDFIRAEIGAMDADTIMEKWAADFASRLQSFEIP